MSGGLFRGTSADQDTRFSNKQSKLLKSQKFPAELDQLVDMTKVKMDVVRPWIANRASELLGFEDEVLINFVYGLLDGKSVDGKKVQIQLTGFMEKNTVRFMKELWSLLLSAQTTSSGVPQQFLDAKEEEMRKRKRKVETDTIAHEIQKRIEREHDCVDDEADNSRAADSIPDSVSKGLMQRASNVHSEEEREVNVRHGRRSSKRERTKSSSVSVSSLSQKHSMSPVKCCSSRSRHTPSPKRRHRSPPRRSISPERRRRSPPRRSISPVRRRRSPPRRSISPVRRRRSPPRRSISLVRRRRSPPRRPISPVRRRRSPPRRSISPIRRRRSPPRRSISPVRWRRSPPRRSISPVRWRRSPPRNYVSPARQYRSPPRRSISPSRRYRSPPRHSVSPRWYSPRHRSPSRQYRAPPRHSDSPRRRYSPLTHRSPSRKNRRRSRSHSRQSSPSPSRRRSPYSHKRSPYLRRISPSPSHHRSQVRKQSSTSRRRSPIRRRSSSLPRHRSLSPPMTSPSPTSPKRRRQSPEHSTRKQAADSRISLRGRKRSHSPYGSRSPRYPSHRSFSREPNDTTNGVKSQRTLEKSSPHDHAQDRGVAVSNDSVRKVLDSISCRLPNSIRSPQRDMRDPSDTCNRLPTMPPKESPNLSVSPIHTKTTNSRNDRSPVKQTSERLPHYASRETNLEAEQTMCVREEPQDKIDCLPYKIKEIPEVGGNKRHHTSDFSQGVHSPDRCTKLAERDVQRVSPSSGVEHGPGSLKRRSSSDDVHDFQNIEKRSPSELDKHKKDVNDESESEFEKDGRKETERKMKEHRKLGRNATKLKTIAPPSDVNKLDDSDLDTARNKDSRPDNTELEQQQQKLEIELRKKALESLRARKGTH